MLDMNHGIEDHGIIKVPDPIDAGIIGALSTPDRFRESPTECGILDVPIDAALTVLDSLDGFATGLAIASSLGGI